MPTSSTKKVTQAELDAEIEKQVQERVKEQLAKHNIDQSPTDLAAALAKLAEVMDKQGDRLESQEQTRNDLIFKAKQRGAVDRKDPWNDTQAYNLMAEARKKAESLGYHLGPWRPVKQENASPNIQSFPFWYVAYCQQCGASAEVRWNPPSRSVEGDRHKYWWPSMFGRAVSVRRTGRMSMVERWAREKGMPFSRDMETGGGMSGGGVAVPHAIDGVHD